MKPLYLPFLVLTGFLIFGCKKEEPATIPFVSTATVTDLTSSTATCGGNITSDIWDDTL
jgi:hypothetical protein